MEIKESLAAILVESRKPLILETIKLPDRLGVGQVLVRLITSGICGAQINEIDAVKGPDNFLPHLLGHEGFAEVIEVGPAVQKVKQGDHVVLHWRPGAGIQSETPKYRLKNEIINAGWVTTFNEYAVVSENRLTAISLSSNPLFAPLLGCAFTTALGVLENDAKISHRDTLLVTGLGGVGVAIIKFAKFLGVNKIIVLEQNNSKKDLALRLGVDYFITAKDKLGAKVLLDEILPITGKPSVAIETTGVASLIEFCYEQTDSIGRVILVGVPSVQDKVNIYTLPLHFGKILTGSKGGNCNPDLDIPLINGLIERGRIACDDFPVTLFSFNEINIAIDALRQGIDGRIIIKFDKAKK